MQSIQIQDIRLFMAALLTKDTFASFDLTQADVVTFASFHIDGTYHRSFLDDPQYAENKYTPWALAQPYLFGLIRGSHTPSKMHLVLRLNDAQALPLLEGTSFTASDLAGLYANITYENESLIMTGGLSLTIFSTDKSLSILWDEYLQKLLRDAKIAFTVL